MKTLLTTLLATSLSLSSFGVTFTVTSFADSGPGTLRQAVIDANANPGADTINISSAGVITIASPLPLVNDSVVISAPGTNVVITASNTCSILSLASGTTNSLFGLTFADGLVLNNLNGGAISNASALTMANCYFTNNRTAGGWGGAIYNEGTLSVTNTRFEANASVGENGHPSAFVGAGGGGAAFGGAICTAQGTVNIINCLFLTNKVFGGNGGTIAGTNSDGGNGGGLTGGLGGPATVAGEAGGFGSGGGGGGTNAAGGAGGFGGGAGGSGTTVNACGNHQGGGGGGGAYGGAICALGGIVNITACVISSNAATGGGGGGGNLGFGGAGGDGAGAAIYNYNATVLVNACSITGNVVTGQQGGSGGTVGFCQGGGPGPNGSSIGGGVAVHGGTIAITNSTIGFNSCNGVVGGATLYAGQSGTISQGGGLFQDGGSCAVVACLINGNIATGGAGAYATRYGGPGAPGNGGGICIAGGILAVTNVTFAQNQVHGGAGGPPGNFTAGAGGNAQGGSFACLSGSATFVNCTVGDNAAVGGATGGCSANNCATNGSGSGGGIFNSGSVSLLNTIVARNTASTSSPDLAGSLTSLGHNLFSTTSGASGFVPSDLQNANPNLASSIASNVGPTMTYSFAGPSPALDAGSATGAPSIDQRGISRPQGSGIDIGALELDYQMGPVAIFVNGAQAPTNGVTSVGPAAVTLLNAFNNGTMLYTLDGSTPTPSSTFYSGPFVISTSAVIRVLAYNSNFTQSGFAGPVQVTVVPLYTLSLSTNGSGTVSKNPSAASYVSNSVVRLVATPTSGNMFLNWSGDTSGTNATNDVVMNGNKIIQANFAPIPKYTLTVQTTGQGTVNVSPTGPYLSNTTVTVVATAAAKWEFASISGDSSSQFATNTIIMTTNKSIRATFNPLYSLLTTTAGGGSIQLSGPGPYSSNTGVTISAQPSNGWTFIQWFGDATETNTSVQVGMTRDKFVGAIFGTPV
ncbi:MAG: hypothetical protein JWO95_1198, partial [Verrucomicrobiales bacterium]|nr:hypothetical protein [Verrucomicrobiales bacterium]